MYVYIQRVPFFSIAPTLTRAANCEWYSLDR